MDTPTLFRSKASIGGIDFDKGILNGVSIITVGEAKGHGKFIDETMVRQVVKQGKEMGDVGLKSRFGHPDMCSDALGTEIGRFKNFRKDGDQARADLHLLDSAAFSPKGNHRKFILNLADEAPDMFATSIVFIEGEPVLMSPGEDDDPDAPEFKFPHARLETLTHCDAVDEGAANDGFFSTVDYTLANLEGFVKKNKDKIAKAFQPILNNNNMADEKSFKDKIGDLLGLSNSEEIEELKAKLIEATEKVQEFEQAQEAIVDDAQEAAKENEGLAEEAEVKDTKIDELTSKVEVLTKTVEKLSKIRLGEVVEEISDEGVQVPADKTEQKEIKHTGKWGKLAERAEKAKARAEKEAEKTE